MEETKMMCEGTARNLCVASSTLACLLAVGACRLLMFICSVTRGIWRGHFGDPGEPFITKIVWSFEGMIGWAYVPWVMIVACVLLGRLQFGAQRLALFVGSLSLVMIYLAVLVGVGVALPFLPITSRF